MIEFKSSNTARRNYDRGQDSAYTPNIYYVFKNTEQVAHIKGNPQHYMESNSWEIVEDKDFNIGKHIFNTLKDAKQYIIENENKII